MSRYIDADALIKACEQWKEPVEHDAQDVAWNHGIDACINEIKHHAPTVNAVEVVRCKDCKYKESCCQSVVTDPDWSLPEQIEYCSYGEKEETEHE